MIDINRYKEVQEGAARAKEILELGKMQLEWEQKQLEQKQIKQKEKQIKQGKKVKQEEK